MGQTVEQWWESTVVANPFLWDETVMGIDWVESTNAYAVLGYKGKVLDQGFVAETPDGVVTLLDTLRRFAHPITGELAAVAIETPRRMLVSSLASHGVTVVPLNPKSVKTARGIKTVRNASKTDPKDAILIANVLRNNPADYHTLHASTQHARAITLLYRASEEAKQDALRLANRIRSQLAEYHPNAINAFGVKEMADDLAAYWVLIDALTPAQGARLRVDGIATRMRKPGGRKGNKGLDKAAERVRDALHAPSLAYPSEFEAAFADTVRTNLHALKSLVEHRQTTEARLSAAVRSHPMWDLLSPATGAGEGAIGGLIAEMGDDSHRFNNRDSLLAFAGVAPAIEQSGGRRSVRRRDIKGNRLHKAVWHWAESASNHEPAAKYYYWTLRGQGDAHAHAIRKIMKRLLRGVHSCVTTGTIWDDDKMWRTTMTPQQIDQFVAQTKARLKAQKAKK